MTYNIKNSEGKSFHADDPVTLLRYALDQCGIDYTFANDEIAFDDSEGVKCQMGFDKDGKMITDIFDDGDDILDESTGSVDDDYDPEDEIFKG